MTGPMTRIAPRLVLPRLVLVVAALVLVLTTVLLGGAAPDTAVQERSVAALDAVILSQAQLFDHICCNIERF